MKRILIKIMLLILIISTTACELHKNYKEIPNELPTITTEGLNTFGCMIDSNLYVPIVDDNRAWNQYKPIVLNYPFELPTYTFFITTTRDLDPRYYDLPDASVEFIIKNVYNEGVYIPSYATVMHKGVYYKSIISESPVVILKLDTTQHIVSGTFSFRAYDNNATGLDTISISDGRFDLKYSDRDLKP